MSRLFVVAVLIVVVLGIMGGSAGFGRRECMFSFVVITGSNGQPERGLCVLTSAGESTYPKKRHTSLDKEGLKTNVWDQTNKTLEDICAGRIFKY